MLFSSNYISEIFSITEIYVYLCEKITDRYSQPQRSDYAIEIFLERLSLLLASCISRALSALVVGHIAAGPEFKVTPLVARIGAVVDDGGRTREGRLDRLDGKRARGNG